METEYKILIIKNIDDLVAIRDDWNNLSSLFEQEYFFINYEWYYLWLKHFLKQDNLYVISIYKEGMLIAVAPFIRKIQKIKNISVKKLELLGNAYSPVRAIIIDRNQVSEDIGNLLLNALKTIDYEWDVVQIGPVYDGNIYEDTKKLFSASKYKQIEKVVDVNWRIEVAYRNYEQYFITRKKSIRQEIRRRQKKLQELGSVEFKTLKGFTAYNYINDYCQVYKNSWKEGERLGPGFHEELAQLAAASENLLLAFIYLNGNPIAAQYRIICGDKCYFLKTAYDKKYHKISPGLILLNNVLKYLMDDLYVKVIDFGPGNEDYKSDWADSKYYYNNLYLINRTVKGAIIYHAYKNILPLFRRLLGSI